MFLECNEENVLVMSDGFAQENSGDNYNISVFSHEPFKYCSRMSKMITELADDQIWRC